MYVPFCVFCLIVLFCVLFVCKCTWSETKKKTRLNQQLGNQEGEGRDKQTAIEHVLTCHSVTRLSSIALLWYKWTHL
jgi:hypothetical protein